jgi:prepilin peptidase CpaA
MTIEAMRNAALGLAGALLITATLWDVALRTIPNTLCAGVAILALGLRGADHEIAGGLIAGVVVFALALVCWMRGWLGGGDVKLLTATAILVPPDGVLSLLATIAIAGGGLAICYLAMSWVVPTPQGHRPARIIPRLLRMERWRIRRRRSLPYAFAITAGAFFTLLNG